MQDPEKDILGLAAGTSARASCEANAEERAETRKRDGFQYRRPGGWLRLHRLSGSRRHFRSQHWIWRGERRRSYHSIYDDFYWYTHFVDTDFSYGRALAQTGGTTVMRLADADLMPFDYAQQAETIERYEKEIEKLLKDKQDEITERNLELKEGVFMPQADPQKTPVPPPVENVPPYMNFAPLKNRSKL